MMEFDGRKAIVTGSAAGLGAAIAEALAKGGADVIINYSKSVSEAEAVADRCRAHGAQVRLVQANVGEDADCRSLAEAAAGWGQLDILVNNAGITKMVPDHADLEGLSKDDFLRLYAVNTVGPFMMTRACRPLLEASFDARGRAASVLNISSIAGVVGIGSSVAYAATKGALNTLTLSLARALAPRIRVNALCPGFIGTRWFKDALGADGFETFRGKVEASTPLNVASGPEDIAVSALFFLSDASRHVTGETLLVDGGTHLGYAPFTAR